MIALDPRWDFNKGRNETGLLGELVRMADLDAQTRDNIVKNATTLVEKIRSASQPGMMEVFLAEYGLSTDEGVALMCLAEALLRVPDSTTIDALIEDKIAPSDWSKHLGRSSSPLVNASTWGLLLTGRVLADTEPGIAGTLHSLIRRVGEPFIRNAVAAAIRQMGQQFVLGEDIGAAMNRARALEAKGYTYSYDMLGEAAMTAEDANRYAEAYSKAIAAISAACTHRNIARNPGISVKLSALHPRYEVAKTDRVVTELVPILSNLARQAADAGMGFNIDAEEADRLGMSMAVIEATIRDDRLKGWDGFGVVVQAYGRRAADVVDGLYQMAEKYDRRLMVRLVKGAYWDTEIKHAQVQGLEQFPVFTRKTATDVSFIALARKLLSMTDRIYPQFATHNAHSVAAILEMAKNLPHEAYELQRLHGMGEALHEITMSQHQNRCRIYAPVGAHRDLLAYLVRRLLENGANSSFVNQIVDDTVPASEIAACPFDALEKSGASDMSTIKPGPELFAPDRQNARGFDVSDTIVLSRIDAERRRPKDLDVKPIIAGKVSAQASEPIINPANGVEIGHVTPAGSKEVEIALANAKPWDLDPAHRAETLRRAADLFERDHAVAFALLASEAGKTLADAVAELREAVDFLRYYAVQSTSLSAPARGVFTCISPWNFPLAIFTGQVAAALAAGNAVLAKPAETTPAIAAFAVERLHAAGVPETALQLLPGEGKTVGARLTSDRRVDGVAFTGSTATARHIQRAMAGFCRPGAPLIAETGGLNAMIVDSTALPEQAIRDILASAFQSAGQRCSALRCLYIQEDIAEPFLKQLIGAMDQLAIGDPWELATDVGPIITKEAADHINTYVSACKKDGRLLHRLSMPTDGYFVPPALIRVGGIEDHKEEIFGPILHVATYPADKIETVIDAVNMTGYGLTFGVHTRIDDRVQMVADRIRAGNVYANRNQIGAIVGSQPFGGEGLSGTGPKAGGPHYLARFTNSKANMSTQQWDRPADITAILASLKTPTGATARETHQLPGPTGELNQLTTLPREPLICAGPGQAAAKAQKAAIEALGGQATCTNGHLEPEALKTLPAFGGVLWWGDEDAARQYAIALSEREGPIVPLVTGLPDKAHACLERHLCVDTTAAGGDTALLAS